MSTSIVIKSSGGGSSSISQAQKIYVDSENGADVATNGNLSSPFLTPEYALTQINNTGTVTGNTSTNQIIAGISDADITLLEVGMYLFGAEIQFGTVITSVNVIGGNNNSVFLSENTTATATGITATFVKIYELILNGSFRVTGSLFQEGVYIRNNGSISHSTTNLFDIAGTVFSSPYKILGNGDYFGLDTASRFISCANTQSSGFTLDIEFGNIYSNYTNTVFNINIGVNIDVFLNIKGGFVDARFGRVGSFTHGYGNINFNSYGLLQGLIFSTSNKSTMLFGRHETPSAVVVISSGYRTYSRADLYGSTTWTGQSSHSGVLSGSTHTLGGVNINSSNGGGSITVTSGSNTFTAASPYTVNVNQNCILNTYGPGNYTFANISGTLNHYGNTSAASTLSGSSTGVINNYGYFYIVSMGSFTGTFNNFADVVAGSFGGGANVNNFGKVRMIYYGIGVAAGKKFVNRGYINSLGSLLNSNAIITLNNATGVFDNYGTIENATTDITKAVIEKTAGTLYLRQGSVLKVTNGLSPIKCTANTPASQDVYYFGVTTNCDGSTYGLSFAFDGASFAPNDLVGGTLYENTNY